MTGSLVSSEYIGWRLVVFIAVFTPLQIITVALRFYARRLVAGSKLTLEDALVLTSLLFQIVLSAVSVATVSQAGVGHHLLYLEEHDPSKVLAWGKYLLTTAVLYYASTNIPKLAILVLYKKLFPMRHVQIMLLILGGILVGQMISTTIVMLAACQPFEANYNPALPGSKCINKESFFTWTSIPNVVTDVAILFFPLPIVWGLHNTRRIKLALTFTFLVGSSGLVTSILRFYTFMRTDSFHDGTWEAVELLIWTVTEPGIYLISACLLAYRPLLERVAKTKPIAMIRSAKNRTLATNYGNSQSGGSNNGGTVPLRKMPKNGDGFTELNDEDNSLVNLTITSNDLNKHKTDGMITVTTDIEIGQTER